jgi:hypothetical protein
MLTKQDVLDSFESRSSHLLDRVRETAKRCISAGIRLDLGNYSCKNDIELDLTLDFKQACEAALFQLAEVVGSGEMYTREDVDEAGKVGYDSGREQGYDVGYEDGFEHGVESASQ